MISPKPALNPLCSGLVAALALLVQTAPTEAGTGWSLGGFAVVMNPAAYDHTVSPGEMWWDGSAGTRFWVDPRENMVTVIMAQIQPTDGHHFREQFKTLVYDAIERHSPR